MTTNTKQNAMIYFEDLVIKHLQAVQKKIEKATPDEYDEMWLGIFKQTQSAYRKAERSYLPAEELKKTLKTLNNILNDKSLTFPDLVQKALDLMTTVQILEMYVEASVAQERFTSRTNALLSLDIMEGNPVVCVELCYDDDVSLPAYDIVCLFQKPATSENIDKAGVLLERLAQAYNIAVFDETMMALVKYPVMVEWLDLGEGLNGDYNPDDPEGIPLLRFDVSIFRNGEWETKEDGSYCTRFPADVDAKTKQKGLRILMERLYDVLANDPDASIKKLGEELSWLNPDSIDNKSTKLPIAEKAQFAFKKADYSLSDRKNQSNHEL